jgi:hypothetical protein
MSHSPRLRDIRKADRTELNRFWNDPAYRRRVQAEIDHANALRQSEFDHALIASGNKWPADWTDAEKADASAALMAKYEGIAA